MTLLRTPDERFASLPDFPFEPHDVELADGIRVHHLDEGPEGAVPVLLLHGEPFPDDTYTAGARRLPSLVPTSTENPSHAANTAAWEVLPSFDKPFLCAFSDKDPVTAGGQRAFLGLVPGTEGQPHTTIEGAGHFLQEDAGEQSATVIAGFIATT